MAEEKKQQSSGLATAVPLMAVLTILASWFFTSPSPYQDERPASYSLPTHYHASQDVEARLWQDPFAAVEHASENEGQIISNLEGKAPLSNPNTHDWKQIYCEQPDCDTNPKDQDITILAVTLPGDSYQESAEVRMRWRYAVLSALANQEAVPDDAQHIGYVQPESKMDLPKKIPFEWWSLPANKGKVLLLWVNESNLLGHPAKKLKELLAKAGQGNMPNKIQYKVIGPNFSTILQDLLTEVKRDESIPPALVTKCTEKSDDQPIKDQLGKINGKNIVYFSAGATASDGLLLKAIDDQATTISSFLCNLGVTLNRTTARDDDMMDVLVYELTLRKIQGSGPVVILSEWDSFYGRSMPESFKTAWGINGGDKAKVHTFSYMRGLDGKLPDKGDKSTSSSEKNFDSKEKSGSNASIELPEGQNQKDYLRRLTHHILEMDNDLKDKDTKKGVAAIGVLGSDVHDKLMILEALRQYFPHKLFFTTDLDARYNHPGKLPQTHNMLVASAFDLKLRPELQGKIPPFRDSYQTALYFATQMALNALWVDSDAVPPLSRLFEIGRSHAIALPMSKDTVLPKIKNKLLPEDVKEHCSWSHWKACNNDVQPPIFATYQFNWSWKGVTIALLVVMLPLLVSWRVRKRMWQYLGGISVILIILAYIIFPWWNHYILQANSEPFYWLEGLSSWPSQLIRLSALLFAVGFYLWGRRRILKMQNEFQLQPPAHNHKPIFAFPTDFSRVKLSNALFVSSWTESNDKKTVLPDDLWKKYLGYCRLPGSLYRVLVHGFAFLVIAALIIAIAPPNAPMREDFAAYLNSVILKLVILATILLTMWVVENARLCKRMIDNLSEKPSQWNEIAKEWAILENEVAGECVDEWLDIQFVARLTETMQLLIWGPMVCIVLLVVARSPAIDDWDLPWGLGVVLIAMLTYAISAELFLQQGAKEARSKALNLLAKKIRMEGNQKAPNETIIKRITAEIERIRMLRQGAFRPWFEWPLLQSIGGLSTIVFVLQYLSEVWEKGTF